MLTKQQRKALLFIEAALQRTGGVAPSMRELKTIFTTAARAWRGGCSSASKSATSFAAYLPKISH